MILRSLRDREKPAWRRRPIFARADLTAASPIKPKSAPQPVESALAQIGRLRQAGFSLSRNDRKIILYGQLLTTLTSPSDELVIPECVDAELDRIEPEPETSRRVGRQKALFSDG